MDKITLEEKLNLVALGEASLSPQEERQVASDPELKHFLTETQGLIQELQGLEVQDPGELFFRKQLKTIQKSLDQERARSSSSPWTWMAVAAALLLAVGIFRFAPWQERSGTQVSDQKALQESDQLLLSLRDNLTQELKLDSKQSQGMEKVLREHRQDLAQLKEETLAVRAALELAQAEGKSAQVQREFKRLRQKEEELSKMQDRLLEKVAVVLQDEEKQAEFLIMLTDISNQVEKSQELVPVKGKQKYQLNGQ